MAFAIHYKEIPSGFGTIKLEQIVRADKELWTLLAQQQTRSLRPSNSDMRPDGLDNLEGLGKLKTELAHQLYGSIMQLILSTAKLGICIIVGDPTNSLYWKTSFGRFLQFFLDA